MGKWPQISLIALGSILAGLGLGPLLAGGAGDLLGRATAVIELANFVTPVMIVTIFLLGVTWYLGRLPRSFKWLQHSGPRWVFAGSIAVAYASVLIANIDSGNTAASRNASLLSAQPDVGKRQMREFGRQFTQLSTTGNASVAYTLGAVPVDWRMWVVGGRADVLLRSQPSVSATESGRCENDNTVEVIAVGNGAVLAKAPIPEQDICGQWRLVQLEMPSGVSEIQVAFGGQRDAEDLVTLDIMVAGIAPKFGQFWTLCIVLGIATVLAVMFLLASNLRDNAAASSLTDDKSLVKKRGYYAFGAVFLFVIASNTFMHWYVSQEKTIYTWDYSGYWMSSRNVSDFLGGAERKSISPQQAVIGAQANATGNLTVSNEPNTTLPDPGAIAALLRSIRFAEYNVSSNLPVAIPMAVFGGSRMVYELSLLNIYALAAVILLIIAVRGCTGKASARWPDWWPLIPVVTVMCCIPFWIPIVRGYMGVSVAAFNLGALWLYFRQPAREIGVPSLLTIGVLLLSGVILQRWNAYWVVGFFFMVLADSVRELIEKRQFGLTEILRSLRAPIVSGFSAFFLFAALAWPKIVRTVTTDYADLYSAFQEDDSLLAAVSRQVDTFGAGVWLLILASIALLTILSPTRRVAILLCIQVLCGFVLFANTQTMGPHQYFIVLPGLLLLLSLGLVAGISSEKRPVAVSGIVASALLLTFGLASAKSVFVYADGAPFNRVTNRLLSQSYRPPLVSNDLESFVRLAQYVDDAMAAAPVGQGIYVLSGSAILNANHFSTLAASTGAPFNSADRVLGSSVVDKRDGFPHGIFRAHIVISSDPVQLNRRPADHQVIRIPVDRLFSGTGIGAAFERLPQEFRLDGGVDAVVFRRIRANTPEEIADLSASLREFYPDRPSVYE